MRSWKRSDATSGRCATRNSPGIETDGRGSNRPRHRCGLALPHRSPSARLAHQVAANDVSITFATAGELWKWSLTRRWGMARRGGLDLWLNETRFLPAGLAVAQVWGSLTTAA